MSTPANLNGDLKSHPALNKSLAHFQRARGADLIARTEPLVRWQDERRNMGVWQYSRSLETRPGPETAMRTEWGTLIDGVNFASQDYLSLSSHPAIAEAAIRAIHDFGVHSAGSANLLGNTSLSLALEEALGKLLELDHVLLFPTGWGAGYGIITGLVRSDDHIVMDALAHACLQSGAYAATQNVVKHPHLDIAAVESHLRDIRAKDTTNGILVITEGLFSMNSDVPDLARLQAVCREWQATLLVDVAHDLGAIGPHGAGSIGAQKMLGQVDLVIGAFSKTFASNGGFLATNSRAARHFVKIYGGPHMFSNALSPVQAAIVLEATRIISSSEGEGLRSSLLTRITDLREAFELRGHACMGTPSPIVPVLIGNEKVARLASALLPEKGVLANLCEFPAVAVNAARFRLQVMSTHTPNHVQVAAEAVSQSISEAKAAVSAWSVSSKDGEIGFA